MDSFKEKDKLAPKPSKRPRIEAAEEPMRRMISYLETLVSGKKSQKFFENIEV